MTSSTTDCISSHFNLHTPNPSRHTKMAHKSHRQKALQAQLEAPQEISIVKPKTPKVSKAESGMDIDDDAVDINQSGGAQASTSSSGFAPLSAAEQSSVIKGEFRRVPIPPHRMTPLKREWVNLYTPMVEMLGLQVRMNVKRRAVEIKVIADGRCKS